MTIYNNQKTVPSVKIKTNRGGRPRKQRQVYKFSFSENLITDLDTAFDAFKNEYDSKGVIVPRNAKFRNAALWTLERIAKSCRFYSSEFADYFYNYNIMRDFLARYDFLFTEKDPDDSNVVLYHLNKKYKGKCEKELTDSEIKALESIHAKKYKRAEKIVSTSGIYFEDNGKKLTEIDVENIMRQNTNSEGKPYTEVKIKECQKIIAEINKTGKLSENNKARRRGRFYYEITEIPECLTNLITLNGQITASLDLHATYLWLLPALIKKGIGKERMPNELSKEIKTYTMMLNDIVRTNGNLYIKLAELFNCGLTGNDIKANVISWYCDPNCNYLHGNIKEKLETAFSKEFPNIRRYLKSLSSGKNRVSTRTCKIEGEFFRSVSAKLKKQGYMVLTKHDCIIVKKSEKKSCLDEISKSFSGKFDYPAIFKDKSIKVAPKSLPRPSSSSKLNQNEFSLQIMTLNKRAGDMSTFVHDLSEKPPLEKSQSKENERSECETKSNNEDKNEEEDSELEFFRNLYGSDFKFGKDTKIKNDIISL